MGFTRRANVANAQREGCIMTRACDEVSPVGRMSLGSTHPAWCHLLYDDAGLIRSAQTDLEVTLGVVLCIQLSSALLWHVYRERSPVESLPRPACRLLVRCASTFLVRCCGTSTKLVYTGSVTTTAAVSLACGIGVSYRCWRGTCPCHRSWFSWCC